MPRNFVICCDGTGNEFGLENTNVVRLVQAIERNPDTQRHYYDPGIGTLPEPGVFTWLGKKLYDLWGLALGTGLTWKAQEAYIYLMRYWEPGDQVFLFGFSRGAYTVRVLAGWLHELGLLGRGNENLVPYSLRLFGKLPKDRGGSPVNAAYWQLRDEFRRTFARPVHSGDDDRRFPVHLLGVWDTVSSVGYVWDPARFLFTAHNPGIKIVRHAVSIDERRCFFRQNLMTPAEGQDFLQLWFPGVHCDIGGGYPESDGGLWRKPFQWMLNEAKTAGLIIDENRLQTVLSHSTSSADPWNDRQHESLTGAWWIAEVFPKLVYRAKSSRRLPQLGLGRHRDVADGQLIHESALRRIRESEYAPPNLSAAFLTEVNALETVPPWLAYHESTASPPTASDAVPSASEITG